ncbi:hypothetical protein AX17_002895 [Amanita inopinata Kibby_2008]|nr:hypothetical protein AX17_002895 [Amanita inopinata Kibby_2008]
MGRTTLRKFSPHLHERIGRVKSRAAVKPSKWPTHKGKFSSGHSPRRRAILRRCLDGRDADQGRHSRTEERLRRLPPRSYHGEDKTYYDEEDDVLEVSESESNGEGDSFHWEEERTLFSDLMEDADTKVHVNDKVTDLVNSLQYAFDDVCIELKRDTARAFVPTVNHIKECYRCFDEQDRSYGKGVLALNTNFKEHEIMVVKEEDELKEMYNSAQNKINDLLHQLEQAYTDRDRLWTRLQGNMEEIVAPVAEMVKLTPANVERTIGGLEKKSKAAERDEGNSSILTEGQLKDLLKRLE